MRTRLLKASLFTPSEKKSIIGLSGILFFRMFGLFLVLPVFSGFALSLEDATPFLVGIAFGAYGLTQGLLQIPFGLLSDRIGRRPVIVAGLLIFIAGCVLAAETDSIHWMIAARFLQGAGAVSSTIFALIADLTRAEVRTRANAFLGGSIGLAFGIAIISAPFLAEWGGLSGIFRLISGMTLLSVVVLFVMVPDRDEQLKEGGRFPVKQMLGVVLREPALGVINLGGFICGAGLSATFFLVPLMMMEHGYERAELWKVYLPMLVLGGLTMIPAAIFSETRNRFREVMLFGIVMLLSSLLLLAVGRELDQMHWFLLAVFLFFMGFNVFEPIFPSLVTRLTTEQTKGTATGVYNFFQFFGHFAGALLAGALYHDHFLWLLGILAVLEILFFYATLSFPNPGKQKSAVPVEPARAVS